MPREAEWESRWWSPIINAEHLAMRERVGMVDLSAFAIFDVSGPGAADYLQGLVVAQVDVPVGRVVYTPLLNEAGGIDADLTIMRLGDDRFRVVTGGGMGMRDKKWFADHLPEDGSAQLTDMTSALYTVGVWGPRARDLVQSVADADLSDAAFPFGTCAERGHRQRPDAHVADLLRRRARLGDLLPDGAGPRLWDTLWAAGQAAWRRRGGHRRLRDDRTDREGLPRPWRRARARLRPGRGGHGPAERQGRQDFLGKAAYLDQRSRPPAAVLCTLTIDDPTSAERRQALHARSRADRHP